MRVEDATIDVRVGEPFQMRMPAPTEEYRSDLYFVPEDFCLVHQERRGNDLILSLSPRKPGQSTIMYLEQDGEHILLEREYTVNVVGLASAYSRRPCHHNKFY